MIAGDTRECRPVDARRRNALLRVGPHRAQALLVTGSRLLPKAIEFGPALGVEPLNGEHCDIAVFRVNPA